MKQISEPDYLADEEAMMTYAETLLPMIEPGQVIYFEGNLGAGKTTIIRALLKLLGHTGPVNSPTYTLIESYQLPICNVHHFDLYRLESSDELEAIGARDLLDGKSICLIEWPYRAQGLVPDPDIQVTIEHLIVGRRVSLQIEKSKCG